MNIESDNNYYRLIGADFVRDTQIGEMSNEQLECLGRVLNLKEDSKLVKRLEIEPILGSDDSSKIRRLSFNIIFNDQLMGERRDYVKGDLITSLAKRSLPYDDRRLINELSSYYALDFTIGDVNFDVLFGFE